MSFTEYAIETLVKGTKSYPKNLLSLKDTPKQLFYRGNYQKELFAKSVAVVGSRRMTHYGRQVLERFIPDFVAANVTIISGFMYGVDTYAHELTIKYGGKTIAVLGNGLDICYPPENTKLYESIVESGGLVMSEYEKDTKPQLWTYPKRNRIVAALSTLGVVVVEASLDSGSIITAKWGEKLGKKVYAVPGPITSSSSTGTNDLIRNNKAEILVRSDQIIKSEHKSSNSYEDSSASSLEAKIIQTLSAESLSLDELSAHLGIEIAELMTQVSMLSLQGKLQEVNGKLYLNS